MTKRFVISGCSRSGTRYISRLITEIGCECAHDNTFLNYQHLNLNWDIPPYGGASWYIAPVLSDLPLGTIILHQIRSPLKFIRSRLRKGKVGFEWVKRFFFNPKHSINFYAKMWIKWNKMVEKKAYFSYRIEDFDKDYELLKKILKIIEFDFNEENLKEIYNKASSNVHTGGPYEDDIHLKDITNPITRYRLKKYAQKFNYLKSK